MTQWVEDVEGGRRRGPIGLLQAWGEVLVRPGRFFEHGVAPGDQGPGLTFLVAVVLAAQGTRFALGTDGYPVVADAPLASGAFWLFVVAVLAAPLLLHVIAAIQTVVLAAAARAGVGATARGGVSETVQVAAYAAAPCALVGVPVAALQIAAGAYAVALYCYGLAVVHELRPSLAVALGVVPGVLAYGYGFRTVEAIGALAAGGVLA